MQGLVPVCLLASALRLFPPLACPGPLRTCPLRIRPGHASAISRSGSRTSAGVNQKRPDRSRRDVWTEDPPTSTNSQRAVPIHASSRAAARPRSGKQLARALLSRTQRLPCQHILARLSGFGPPAPSRVSVARRSAGFMFSPRRWRGEPGSIQVQRSDRDRPRGSRRAGHPGGRHHRRCTGLCGGRCPLARQATMAPPRSRLTDSAVPDLE